MIAYSRDGQMWSELAGVGLDGDLPEGRLYPPVDVLERRNVPVQSDPEDARAPVVGIRTDVSQPERERANRFDGVRDGIGYRFDLAGVYVTEELEREMHVFGSDGLKPANPGLSHLVGEMTQSGSHVVREPDG